MLTMNVTNSTIVPVPVPVPILVEDSHLEWPSAFFALLCMALNNITQPSGRICEMPYSLRFLARSSPILCAVDATTTLVLWLKRIIWHWEGAARAASHIARARFKEIDGESDDNLTALERNFAFRCAVFGFGTLPQAIKLFACRGIMIVQIAAAMYLGSWAIFEVLMLLAQRSRDHDYDDIALEELPVVETPASPWSRRDDISERRQLYIAFAVLLQAIAYNWGNLLDPEDPNADGEHKIFGTWMLRLMTLQCGCLIWAEVVRLYHARQQDRERWYMEGWLGVAERLFSEWEDWTGTISIFSAIVIELVIFMCVMKTTGYDFEAIEVWQKENKVLGWLAIAMVSGVVPVVLAGVPVSTLWVSNVGYPLAWFLVRYESGASYKPKWTEYLG